MGRREGGRARGKGQVLCVMTELQYMQCVFQLKFTGQRHLPQIGTMVLIFSMQLWLFGWLVLQVGAMTAPTQPQTKQAPQQTKQHHHKPSKPSQQHLQASHNHAPTNNNQAPTKQHPSKTKEKPTTCPTRQQKTNLQKTASNFRIPTNFICVSTHPWGGATCLVQP